MAGGPPPYAYVADPLTQLDVLGLSEGSGRLGDRMVGAGQTHGISPFPKSDFRAHHLIPHKAWVDNQKFFDDIGLNHTPGKINPKDAASTGVFLPRNNATGTQHGFDQYHSGNHPATSKAMTTRVENVKDRFNRLARS